MEHFGIMYFIAIKYEVLLGKFLERLTVLEGLYNDRDGITYLKSLILVGFLSGFISLNWIG